MQISRADMLLIRAQQLMSRPIWHVANLESAWLAGQLKGIAVDRPVFVCGLARSGSTMLLELFSQLPGVATHRYRDFPFVSIPWLWNQYLDWTTQPAPPAVERPHRDGIMIGSHSPESMDEPLWRTFGTGLPLWQFKQTANWIDHPMSRFFSEHLRKLLLIRGGQRIVGKNNYHVARIPVLATILDAQFVIPVRHPVEHVQSLMRQHELFCQYSLVDRRVPEYLKAACHFEFGPQRQAFCPTRQQSAQIETAWQSGHDLEGYARQWTAIYQYVLDLLQCPELSPRIHVIKYEDFCQQPSQQWLELCQPLGFGALADRVALDHIRLRRSAECDAQQVADIWAITQTVATAFGYWATPPF